MKSHLSRLYQFTLLFYLGFPMTYLGTLALLYNIPGVDLTKILLQPTYYILSLGGVITGWGLMDAKRWSWYAMRIMNLAMVYFSVVMLVHYGQTNHSVAAFFISIVLVWVLDRGISRELRVPYFMPQISWWESDPRFQIRIPAKVFGQRGETLEGHILDLSATGCFLKVRPEIPEQSQVTIECNLFGREWKGAGTVVWQTFGAVTFPRGLGIKFSPMDRYERRIMKAATLRVRKLALLYRRGRYLLSEEELNASIEKLKSPLLPPPQGRP